MSRAIRAALLGWFVSAELFAGAAWLQGHIWTAAGLAFLGLVFTVGAAMADFYVVSQGRHR